MKNLVENIEKKVNKLIQLYQSAQKEKEETLTENNQLISDLSDKDKTINSLEEKIKLLRITKSVSTQDDERNKESRQKINEYVREIDKCIALLNK
ncbi:MAG: hypothetical protein HOB15_01990 [Flavobacteriales bacterium]|jgi:uncharacterized protein YoxC|nr:hypothetical protein [Flavobacteriales bacterium]MDG2060114.1 hypothetical protein [Flavobacteriales bacterium]|tara:strand:- start:320 stop:604 length:285 start_codon:yes stop_codon:yes gene_type:complete